LRRFYKNWKSSKKKAFSKYTKNIQESQKDRDLKLKRIKHYCTVIRVIAHT